MDAGGSQHELPDFSLGHLDGQALMQVALKMTSRAEKAAFRMTCKKWKAAFDGSTTALRSGFLISQQNLEQDLLGRFSQLQRLAFISNTVSIEDLSAFKQLTSLTVLLERSSDWEGVEAVNLNKLTCLQGLRQLVVWESNRGSTLGAVVKGGRDIVTELKSLRALSIGDKNGQTLLNTACAAFAHIKQTGCYETSQSP